jgi:hypothetical protein
MLQAEVVELPVEASIVGCEHVEICGLILDSRNHIAGPLKKFGVVVRVIETEVSGR